MKAIFFITLYSLLFIACFYSSKDKSAQSNRTMKILDSNLLLVNSSGKMLKGKFIEVKGCRFSISYFNGNVEEISTSDKGFKTNEGVQIGMLLSKLKNEMKGRMHKIELYNMTDTFYKLESGWIINIKNDFNNEGHVEYMFTRDCNVFSEFLNRED